MKLIYEDFNKFYNSNKKFRNTEVYYLPLDLTERNVFGTFRNNRFTLHFVTDPLFDECENYIKLCDKIILLRDIASFDILQRIIKSRL